MNIHSEIFVFMVTDKPLEAYAQFRNFFPPQNRTFVSKIGLTLGMVRLS